MSSHQLASCNVCDWTHDGADADRAAHLHTTSKAKGHERHATTSRSHPRHLCTTECTQRPRRTA